MRFLGPHTFLDAAATVAGPSPLPVGVGRGRGSKPGPAAQRRLLLREGDGPRVSGRRRGRWSRGPIAAGLRALDSAEIVAGPDLGPPGAPYLEGGPTSFWRLPASAAACLRRQRAARGTGVLPPHYVALCKPKFLSGATSGQVRLWGLDESLGDARRGHGLRAPGLGLWPAGATGPCGASSPSPPSLFRRSTWRSPPGSTGVKDRTAFIERLGLYSSGRMAVLPSPPGFSATAGVAWLGLPLPRPGRRRLRDLDVGFLLPDLAPRPGSLPGSARSRSLFIILNDLRGTPERNRPRAPRRGGPMNELVLASQC